MSKPFSAYLTPATKELWSGIRRRPVLGASLFLCLIGFSVYTVLAEFPQMLVLLIPLVLVVHVFLRRP